MQEYDYPIGGPCGWMWARKKEPSLAQDNNPNHLPAGSPDSTGGRFAKKDDGAEGGGAQEMRLQPVKNESRKASEQKNIGQSSSKNGENDKAYLKDAIDPADELFGFLPSGLSLKTLSVLKVLPSLSKETITWLEKHFAEEEAEKALAGAQTWIAKEGKEISNFFEKKGVPQKPHTNKYAEKSKTNSKKIAEKAKAEREALLKIDLRLPNSSKELFEEYEKEGHLLKKHMIDGNTYNLAGMKDAQLIERGKTGKSASAIHNMPTLTETYATALKRSENQNKLRRLLAGFEDKVWVEVEMNKVIGRYVKQGSSLVKSAKRAAFVMKRTKNNSQGYYPETLELRP